MVIAAQKKVVVIGLGITGLSCVDYLLANGVIPKVIDTRERPSGYQQLAQHIPHHFGGFEATWIAEADLIIVSPGIALSTPLLQQAADRGCEIIGDIELFCREINQKPDVKVIAITGANGKTTVTTLVGEMLKASGYRVAVGGNIGQPALTLLSQPVDVVVLELSSFQLETTKSLHTVAATILNISEDHMDRYPQGLSQYRQAKLRIYQHSQHCIINSDDPLTWPEQQSSQYYHCLSFGLHSGNYQLKADSQGYWLLVHHQPMIHSRDIALVGVHNYLNCLAALALVDQVVPELTASLQVLQTFTGLAHRYQLIYEHRGIRWINDSKATNVGSTEAALKGTVTAGVLYLLLGGDGKAADFSSLIPYLQQPRLKIFCFGRDGQQLAALNPSVSTYVETLKEAMQAIAKQVTHGDTVLLSPACASLDQYQNYQQRGDEFTRLAKELG